MKSSQPDLLGAGLGFLLAFSALCSPAHADSLLDRARVGEPVRIGYADEAPYAYQDKGRGAGFANVVAIEVLKRMGITRIEDVVTEWRSLIPELQVGRFDIITAGMYVSPLRCREVAFSQPMGVFAEAFLVAQGNPLNLHSFADVRDKTQAVLVTGSDFASFEHALRLGIPKDRIVLVFDPDEMLDKVAAGRAHAASGPVFEIRHLNVKAGGKGEIAKPFAAPEFTKGYSSYAFRKEDREFLSHFNAELKALLSTKKFLELVEPFGYREEDIPDRAVTADPLCAGS